MKCLFVRDGKIDNNDGEPFEVVVVPSSDAHGPHVELVDKDGDKVLLLFSREELNAIAEISSALEDNRLEAMVEAILAEGGGCHD